MFSLTVPPAQVAALLDALEHLRASTSEGQRSGYDGMIAALERSAGQPVRLTAAPELLREALLVAIDEAGENVSRLCTELLRAGGAAEPPQAGSSAGELRARVTVLSELLDLLDTRAVAGRSSAERSCHRPRRSPAR